jgi:hypothetical protein
MVAWGTVLLHPQKMILLKLPPLILLQVFHPHICLTHLFLLLLLLLLLLLIVLLLSLLLVPDMLFLSAKSRCKRSGAVSPWYWTTEPVRKSEVKGPTRTYFTGNL